MDQPKKPTLKTISEMTGFAVPTVSRALKGAPDIGKSTIEKVRKTAREIGYVPDRAGVRLRTGRTHAIALVLSTEHDMMNHTARLISAMAGSLRRTDYHLIVTPYFTDEDPLKPVRQIVETGSADAIILNRIQPEDPRVDYLLEHNFPFATHGRTEQSHRHAYFDFDNQKFAQHGVEMMAERGRKNILLIGPPPSETYAMHMQVGADQAATQQRVRMTRLPSVTSDDKTNDIKDAVRQQLENDPSVDGILCPSTRSAVASASALNDLGLVIGETVDICAKEAVEFLELVRPGILSIREDVARAGDFLARAALQAIQKPNDPPLQGLDFPSIGAKRY